MKTYEIQIDDNCLVEIRIFQDSIDDGIGTHSFYDYKIIDVYIDNNRVNFDELCKETRNKITDTIDDLDFKQLERESGT